MVRKKPGSDLFCSKSWKKSALKVPAGIVRSVALVRIPLTIFFSLLTAGDFEEEDKLEGEGKEGGEGGREKTY